MACTNAPQGRPCPCGCTQRLPAPSGQLRARGALAVDHAALRAALQAEPRLTELLEAKATGRPTVNAAVMWSHMTATVYKSGDLPVIATRETTQNAIDAIRAAISARQIRAGEGTFAVTWEPARRALTWEDNGIGMDTDAILTKFLSLGDSGKGGAVDSAQAAGGFGVAKAVILGASATFEWEMHTRDNRAVSRGMHSDVEIFDAPFRQGTRITIFGVDPKFLSRWDHARQAYVPLLQRLAELLGANDLPDIRLTLNGAEVRPLFSRRGGARVALAGSWGPHTTATVKAYKRPPGDRLGAYYVRLNGLYQFRGSSWRNNLKADIVIDLHTRARPGSIGYPLDASRESLMEDARAVFEELVAEVERENESVGEDREAEVFEPEADTDEERSGAHQIAEATRAAFDDPGVRVALEGALGAIADFYAGQNSIDPRSAPVTSAAPPGKRAHAEPADVLGSLDGVALIRAALSQADAARAQGGESGAAILNEEVRHALHHAEALGNLATGEAEAIGAALDRAADAALSPGGGGLLQAAGLGRAQAALARLAPDAPAARRSPFGKLAALRVSKKNYDRRKARRFRDGFGRWIPHLTAWDATLRLIAAEARIRRPFKPGFVLDDTTVGMAERTPAGHNVIYLHPDRYAAVLKVHKERPLAIAAFLHGVACHELAHIDGRMGKGHDEAFIAAREDLGAATAHLLPAIAALVARVHQLPVVETPEQRALSRLTRQLQAARAEAKTHRKARADVTRLEAELDALHQRLSAVVEADSADQDPRAVRIIDGVGQALRQRAPAGIDPAYIDAFLARNRAALIGRVSQALRRV